MNCFRLATEVSVKVRKPTSFMLFRQTFTRTHSLFFQSASSSSTLFHWLSPIFTSTTTTTTTNTPISLFTTTKTASTMSSSQDSTLRAIVISGPSGSGKSTLLNKLFGEFPGIFSFSISHTTRQPRAGEENGREYHFITRKEFMDLKDKDGFLESAEFSGNCYGTSKKSVTDISSSGRLCVLDVEINGVKNIKNAKLSPIPRYIFIRPPSIEELKKRLEGRGTETEESLLKRLNSCQEALDYADIPGSYDHVIVNNDLEVAYQHLKGILIADIHKLQAEKLKKGE